jgi:hypothetical protein
MTSTKFIYNRRVGRSFGTGTISRKEKTLMPQLYPYRIFISHAWDYNDEYYRLEKLLKEYPNFDFRNYSVPKHDPLDTSTQLEKKLLDQMNPTQVVIVLAGMYAAHSEWIQFEINEAKRLKKPILGVRPWGQERVPQAVQDAANIIHGWNVAPIVASIRDLA